MLLGHLPRSSSYVAAVVGPSASWSDTEYLLAHAIDALNRLAYIAHVGFRLTGRAEPPQPLDRPGNTRRRRTGNRKLTPAQLRKALGMKDR